jgi:hypothetical protein
MSAPVRPIRAAWTAASHLSTAQFIAQIIFPASIVTAISTGLGYLAGQPLWFLILLAVATLAFSLYSAALIGDHLRRRATQTGSQPLDDPRVVATYTDLQRRQAAERAAEEAERAEQDRIAREARIAALEAHRERVASFRRALALAQETIDNYKVALDAAPGTIPTDELKRLSQANFGTIQRLLPQGEHFGHPNPFEDVYFHEIIRMHEDPATATILPGEEGNWQTGEEKREYLIAKFLIAFALNSLEHRHQRMTERCAIVEQEQP